MAEGETQALQVKEKQEVTTAAESTKSGPTFIPAVDIFETEQEITLLADIPGVKPKDLDIDLRENTLTLTADVESPAGPNEEDIIREYETGRFFRQFTLSEVIDQSKIEAQLNDGVLRLRLPKVEKATPRKITIKS